jgi:ketosteroid isomerase-like protein
MSENLDLVRPIHEPLARGDFSSTEWAHPDIEFEIVDGPSPGCWTGVASATKAWDDFLSAWEDFRIEPDEYRELDGERVLVLGHRTGRGKTSELEVGQARAVGLFHVRDGRVTRLVFYFDRDRSLADLGLKD